MRVKFYGHSDDCLEIEIVRPDGKTYKDEWTYRTETEAKDGTSLGLAVRVATIGETRAVNVRPVYDGCWSFAVGLIEEDRTLPPWRFSVEDEHPYSVALIIDTGDDAVTVRRGDGRAVGGKG